MLQYPPHSFELDPREVSVFKIWLVQIINQIGYHGRSKSIGDGSLPSQSFEKYYFHEEE